MSSRLSLVSSAIIVAVVFAGVTGLLFFTNQYDPPRIAVFTTMQGLDDYGFGNQTELGIEDVQGAMAVWSTPWPVAIADAVAQMTIAASSGNYELIVAVGEEFTDAVEEVASNFPGQRFALLGGEIADLSNVVSATFALEEAAYLAGVAAAHVVAQYPYNETGSIIGILGSFETDPTVSTMVEAFKNGVEAANATYGLNVALGPEYYLASDNASLLAQTRTRSMFVSDDVSLIFAPVGASMVGVKDGMELANMTFSLTGQPDRKPLVISAGTDLEYYGLPDPDVLSGESWITTSVVPRVDAAVYTFVNATFWNDFPGGHHYVYDLSNGGVNITSFRYSSTYILYPPFDVMIERIKLYQAEIIANTLDPLA